MLKRFNTRFLTQLFIETPSYIKWVSEQMIFVFSAKVSLNHWTICFSNALILSSSGAILKSTGAMFQAKRSAFPCKMCLSESSLKMLTLYLFYTFIPELFYNDWKRFLVDLHSSQHSWISSKNCCKM